VPKPIPTAAATSAAAAATGAAVTDSPLTSLTADARSVISDSASDTETDDVTAMSLP